MSNGNGSRKVVLEVKRMSEHIIWTDRPSFDDSVPRFDIEVVPRVSPIRGVIINPRIDGFDSHYDKDLKATIPCLREQNCSYCQRRVRVRWDGFLFVMSDRKRLYILRISEGARKSMERQVDMRKLRGFFFTAKRTGPHKNSPVELEMGDRTDSALLPEVQNIRPTVARALGLDRERRLFVEFAEERGEVVFNVDPTQVPLP